MCSTALTNKRAANIDGERIPTAYRRGHLAAVSIDADLAGRYAEHMIIGDPLADAAVGSLVHVDPQEVHELIQAGMDQDQRRLEQAPEALRSFFAAMDSPPEWLDKTTLASGSRMFFRNSDTLIGALAAGSLIEGFSTNISKSFFITGHLRDQGERRLKQNNRHMTELFIPGGMDRKADGWKMTVRVRLVHANMRRLLSQSDEWDHDAWGTPLSAAHMAFGIAAFSARLMSHAEKLGAKIHPHERSGFMATWRYVGHLFGVPDVILPKNEAGARLLFAVGRLHEPEPDIESVVMAHSLLQSAPIVIGITDTVSRRKMAGYIFAVSKAMIGKQLAQQLRYPSDNKMGVLFWYRAKTRFTRIIAKLLPRLDTHTPFHRFSALMESSLFDEAGISYRLPNHVFAERSAKW